MTFTATTFLSLWLLFTLIFIIFLFFTLNALGKQSRYKFKLTLTLTSLLLGLICFVGIFTDQSLYKNTNTKFSFKDKLSFFNNKDKPKPAPQPKQNTNQNKGSEHHYSSDEIKAKGYEYEYDYFPVDFKPTTASGKIIKSKAETLKVGQDIEPGYYRIIPTGKSPSGIITMKNPFDKKVESHFLSKTSGPSSLTTYLVEGHTLVLNKKEKANHTKYIISPEKHKMRTSLTAGTYIVGTDVKSGTYEIKSDNSGNFIVTSDKKEGRKYNEILKDDFTKTLSLNNGDMIYIKGNPTVSLLPR
ncbi:hypothetical protein ACY2DA_09225 [Staphylococcus simulans]